jgi:hypothetical protein
MHDHAPDEIEINWVEQMPWQYREFQTIFNGETANTLPPYRLYDNTIDLNDRTRLL